MKERVPFLFRSYDHPPSGHPNERNPGISCTYPIWKVARAASAAPSYFKPMKLEGKSYIDGGFGANNPTSEALSSIRQLHDNKSDAVQVLISIGTGQDHVNRRTRARHYYHKMWSNVKTMRAMATDTEDVHRQMLSDMKDRGHYCRLNVQQGLGSHKVPLDACKGEGGSETFALIRSKTNEYLQTPDAIRSIQDSAQRLVDIRRERINGPDLDRWEKFCHGLKFRCQVEGCQDLANRSEERETLRQHLQEEHSILDAGELEALLDRGKCYSVEIPE